MVEYSPSREELEHELLAALRNNHRHLLLREFEETRFAGLYAVWYRHRCLYVGKSDQQTVYNRLWRHVASSHNAALRLWVRVKNGELRFTTLSVETSPLRDLSIQQFIDAAEALLIHKLDPETNIQRPGRDKWLALFPPCAAS